MKVFFALCLLFVFGFHSTAKAFSRDSLVITLKGGKVLSFPLGTSLRITFDTSGTNAAVHTRNANATDSDIFAYPNPMVTGTTIEFDVPQTVKQVTIGIYASDGSLIRAIEIFNCRLGKNLVPWDGRDSRGHMVPSGSYFCEVTIGSQRHTKQLVVLH
jgi:flagellar hook assembly protein FlgD